MITKLFKLYDNNIIAIVTSLHKKPEFLFLKNCVIEHTAFLPINTALSQRLWHIVYSIKKIPRCIYCENLVKFRSFHAGYYKYCSSRCSNKDGNKKDKIKKTCLKKYGVENISQLCAIKEKKKHTYLKKYGVENVNQACLIKERKKLTCLNKYGVTTPLKCSLIKKKIKLTCLRKYGVENPSQVSFIQEKKKQSCLKKFGVKSSNASLMVKEKKKLTWMANYGVDNPFKSPVVREKYKQSMLNKYGTVFPYENTSIEIALQEALKKENIHFEAHKSIYGQPDIFIEPKLCVFADGDYWHNYPHGKDRDKQVNDTLEKNGYKVLRFWERDIKNNLGNCIKKIKENIEKASV